MNISWTNRAESDNLNNIDYLFEEWNINVVLKYEQKIIETENLLLYQPHLGQFDKELNLYKILVIPQIYMIYEVNENTINIIRIWNNYKLPFW